MFYAAKIVMIVSGIWRMELPTESNFWITAYRTYSTVAKILLSTTVFALGAKFPALLEKDALAAMENASLTIASGVVLIKAMACQSRKNIQLVRTARQEEDQLYTHPNKISQGVYSRHVDYCQKLALSIAIVFFATTLALIAQGAQKNYALAKTSHNNTVEKPHILLCWYPFHTENYHFYILVDQAIRVLNTGTCNLSVNIFIETVLLFLRAQLIILQEQFRSFHKGADEAPIANADQVNHQGLKKLCISHRKLIYFLASFNDSLKFIMLLEYVASSLIIASSILEVLGGHNVPFNAGFVVTNFGGLMLLSWNCNEIMVQSVKLATALYESKWYEQDKQSNALLQIMMIRSQKPLVITIGSFGPMTLDAGMSRMRLAYSYTTVLGSNF
ncbi:odorant receptor 30a-like isoform X1 [Cylas formicarius]|uniref:odorant receptor 30a-like isoform X1 n=1 Tax=Cylas formicarius TaxID=197179 RepID=UPI00295861BE|nr:odorant receptor 30a-like isoform X1 [Cylas formicarius]